MGLAGGSLPPESAAEPALLAVRVWGVHPVRQGQLELMSAVSLLPPGAWISFKVLPKFGETEV